MTMEHGTHMKKPSGKEMAKMARKMKNKKRTVKRGKKA